MSYPSVNEFKNILLSVPLEAVVREYVFEGVPYVFREKPHVLKILHQHLCPTLKVPETNVVVVGSAKIGFSLSPHNFPRQFSDESDIDVIIVDESLFDEVWKTMLKCNYPRRYRLNGTDLNWTRRRMNDLYWGWFVPDKIRYDGLSFPSVLKPLRDISTNWFNAFRSLSRKTEFASRDVSGRLYRSWDHALLYHVEGLRQISNDLRATKGRGEV